MKMIVAMTVLTFGSTVWYMVRWELDNMTSPVRY